MTLIVFAKDHQQFVEFVDSYKPEDEVTRFIYVNQRQDILGLHSQSTRYILLHGYKANLTFSEGILNECRMKYKQQPSKQ